jgi:hypothetical protein
VVGMGFCKLKAHKGCSLAVQPIGLPEVSRNGKWRGSRAGALGPWAMLIHIAASNADGADGL